MLQFTNMSINAINKFSSTQFQGGNFVNYLKLSQNGLDSNLNAYY